MPGAPWYRQFWPWFLIAVPALSVVGGVATLFVAIRHADSVVRDDWYARGVAINVDLERERLAAELGIAATVSVGTDAREVWIALEGITPDPDAGLALELSHPTQAARDTVVRLVRSADGVFRGTAPHDLRGRWNASLIPPTSAWRVTGSLALQPGVPVRLAPRA